MMGILGRLFDRPAKDAPEAVRAAETDNDQTRQVLRMERALLRLEMRNELLDETLNRDDDNG